MATLPLLDDATASPEARQVFQDIRTKRNTDYVNNFWRALANDPAELCAVWERAQAAMAPGALDPLVKEMIYVAVSVTNGCEYCTYSHTAAARKKGMSDAMFMELMAVVGLANQTNRLSDGLRMDVDPQFIPRG